ncbi:DUF2339 domain-containing protein [Nocardia sp. NPDC050630]|uniref:DUF2339 domain-containing protein n=1 Tax=Nocardia sp. NPDC050630 TaxID=3364321 RepID=UPI00379F3CEF
MTTSIDPALISRLSGEFTALGRQMGILGRDLDLLRAQVVTDLAAAERVSKDSTGFAVRGEYPLGPVPPGGSGEVGAGAPGVVGGQTVWPQAPSVETTGGAGHTTDAAAASTATGESAAGRTSQSGAANTPMAPKTAVISGGSTVPGAGAMQSAPVPGWVGRIPMPPVAPSGWARPVPGYGQSGGIGMSGWAAVPAGVVGPSGVGGGFVPPRAAGGAAAPGMPPRPPGWGAAKTPWWQQEGMISRVLAVAGVGVTLIGVVMLLVLAAQAGFFGPVPRVVAGAVFSAALVGAGAKVFGRAGGRVGGISLAATGIAGAYLDVVAVTAIYDWLHPVVGLAVASGVAAGGVGLAMRWQSQPLAVLVVAGAALLSPFVTSELVLLAFLIVLQLTCVPVQLIRDWPFLHVVRTVPAILATLLAITIAVVDDAAQSRVYWLLTAAVAIAAIGLVGGFLVVRRRSDDIVAALTSALSMVALLAAPAMFERHAATLVAAVGAAVLLAVASLHTLPKLRELVRIPGSIAFVAMIAGSFALLEACVGVTRVQTLPIALFLAALCYLGLAGQRRSRITAAIGAAFTLAGSVSYFTTVTPEVLATQRLAHPRLGIATALGAVLALAVIAVGIWCARRLPGMTKGGTDESTLFVVASIAGLYAVTAAAVSIGVATGSADGFIVGHSAATILWMAAATAALLFGLRNLSRSAAVAKLALGSGLLVTAAALAKLFLFDLATLDGLVRVTAFLVVGILLLVTGTRYARTFAEVRAGGVPIANPVDRP